MMKFIRSLVVISLVALARCDENISNLVVNGMDAHILDHPYMAGIHVWFQNSWAPFCGSTIINRRSVLTVGLFQKICKNTLDYFSKRTFYQIHLKYFKGCSLPGNPNSVWWHLSCPRQWCPSLHRIFIPTRHPRKFLHAIQTHSSSSLFLEWRRNHCWCRCRTAQDANYVFSSSSANSLRKAFCESRRQSSSDR